MSKTFKSNGFDENIDSLDSDNLDSLDSVDSVDSDNLDSSEPKYDDKKIEDMMKIDYRYPDPSDKELQYKLYKKRELYYNKIQKRPSLNDYNEIKEYRDNMCDREFSLYDHQALLSNFINPDTPYKGILIFHGVGSGKCIESSSLININNALIKIGDIWLKYKTDEIIDKENNGIWSKPSEILEINSYNNKFKKLEKRPILNLYREKINSYIRKITLDNDFSISITFAHKLLKVGEGWTNNLIVGDHIAFNNSNNLDEIIYIKIKSIEIIKHDDYVYDLEVEENHSYIANGIISHNTCAAVAIGEKFKPMVQKYGTKIYILVSGPLIKENWKNHLLKCTGETYLKYQDKSIYIDEAEKSKLKKNALNQALQYYRFMSYRSFYKRVLGEKIVEKKIVKGSKVRVTFRKTDEGEFERDLAVDRIFNLNNSLIIADEAHNLTGNAYGDALTQVIKNSTNLKIVLLTATPMKNLADDIVELLNFIRPQNAPIERDKVFNSYKNHQMNFKEGGIEYIKNMARGYVSHLRGADPITYAKSVEMGKKPNGLLFTKIVQCKMLPFQQKIYDEATIDKDDSLDRRAEAVANFAFPGLSQDRKDLIGYYGREGVGIVKNQLKSHYNLLNKKIATDILKEQDESDFINLTDNGRTITGKILQLKYLKYFSIKFYTALKKLNRLVYQKKGAKTAFIYSNLVKVGIEMFQEILLQNGFLEFQENHSDYQIKADTICYYCGLTYREHQIIKIGGSNNSDSDNKINNSSSEYDHNKKIPKHDFHPATFITITGKTTDESAEYIPEDKQRILDNVFSTVDNKEGKYIKFVLGSKVMNEGISLKNVSEVHILDVYFNLGKVDQVIGRAIRYCSHYKLMNENNIFPEVKIYKYAVSIPNGLSSEEELYQKAELKYLLIKKVERCLKEVSIDCPLNMYGNMFKEEIEKYAKCGEKGEIECPALCDYTKCNYKCDDIKLNAQYYDPERNIYRSIEKNKLDYTTFTIGLARNEIDYSKKKIKELYAKNYVYTLDKIVEYVKESYIDEKKDLFDDFFVYKALQELIPLNENDFNNYKDTIVDKFNQQGYLIFNNNNYIFQPFDQNEDVTMYYRTTYNRPISNQLSLYNYLKNTIEYQQFKGSTENKKEHEGIFKDGSHLYDFDSVMDYYDNREEFKFVGIIDKELSRRKNKQADELVDVFKIRSSRAKLLDKKRGTGIPSLKGAVCSTSKNKKYLEYIMTQLGLTEKISTRSDICDLIRSKMLELEKYSTEKNKNKITYVMIPAKHPIYPFPYNLEDRVKFITNKIKNNITVKMNMTVDQEKKNGFPIYKIKIQDSDILSNFYNIITDLKGEKIKKEWVITIE